MVFKPDGQISEDAFDALYELGNVGSGMASIALGKMLGVRVVVNVPSVIPVQKDIAAALSLDKEQEAVGILMKLQKTLGGAVLLLTDKAFMEDVVETMTGLRCQGEELLLNEDTLSAIQELANIICMASMKAIGKYTNIKIYLSSVMVGIDAIGALIAFPMAQMGLACSQAVCVDTRFSLMSQSGEQSQDAGHLIFLPDGPSVRLLVQALGM